MKFTPDDFRGLCWGITSPTQFGDVVADRANEILDRWLAEAPTLWKPNHHAITKKWFDEGFCDKQMVTHTAKLVCIEEIKK